MLTTGLVFFALSALFSALLTPLAIRVAFLLGVHDHPGRRKVHTSVLPRMGGVAVGLSLVLALGFGALLFHGSQALPTVPPRSMAGFSIGALLLLVVGLIDDFRRLSALVKLSAQLVAAALFLIAVGPLEKITLDGARSLAAGWIGPAIAFFWIIGCVNALNLIDGLDGLASGIALIASTTVAWSAVQADRPLVALVLIALAGGVAGFLPFNRYPARVFLGDSGALLLGFVLAVAPLLPAGKPLPLRFAAGAVLALGLPVADTVAAFFRRLWRRRSVLEGDKGHIHHRLLLRGRTHSQAVWILYGLSAVLAGCSLWLSQGPEPWAWGGLAAGGGLLLGFFLWAWASHGKRREA